MRYEATSVAALGTQSRGGAGYSFGDWTRGVLTQGALARGGAPGYQFGDFTRGLFQPGLASRVVEASAVAAPPARTITRTITRSSEAS